MTHTPIKVACIEDSAQDAVRLRRALREALTSNGFEFMHLDDTHDFIRKLTRFGPDIILLDYMIPGVNGLDALINLRSSLPSVAVIMVTGSGSEALAVDALKNGARDYIVKENIDSSTLARSIFQAMALEQYGRQQHVSDLIIKRLEMENQTWARHSTDAMISLDASAGIVRCTPTAATLLGRPVPELLGRNFHELVHRLRPPGTLHDPYACGLQNALRNGDDFDLADESLALGDGDFIRTGIQIRAMAGADGPAGFLVRLAGDADEAQARQHIRYDTSENAGREDMMNVFAHLVQTPLMPVILQLRQLRRHEWNSLSQKQQDALLIIERNIKRLGTVFETARMTIDLERGKHRIHPETIDLVPMTQKIINTKSTMFEEKEVRHQFTSPLECLARVDLGSWPRIISPILEHALRRSIPGGIVETNLEITDEVATLSVTDAGEHMEAAEVRGMLDPFGGLMQDFASGEQVERGMQLYIANMLSTAHGGSLVATNLPNGGSMISVEIPLTDDFLHQRVPPTHAFEQSSEQPPVKSGSNRGPATGKSG